MLMVEHHMDVVTGLAQRIAVMHHGALLAVRHAGRGDGERDGAVGLPGRGAVSAVAAKTLLWVRDLHVYLGQSHILQGVTFDVPEGGVTALLGRNGVGKTTTLRAILGLVGRRGSVRARRRGADAACRRIGSSSAASATCPRIATSSPA